jgi:peptidoglycan hydrolase-like protein with peptidoglycan-binding domain
MDETKQKLTGLNAINTTLNRGSVGDQVKALQQYLIGLGYTNIKPDGVYGPMTESAVKQYQLDNGLKGDGIFGPISLQKAQTLGSSAEPAGAVGSGKDFNDPNYIPKTKEELDAYIKAQNAEVVNHPVFAGNSQEMIDYASSTGDFSQLLNSEGKPFSQADQESAYAEANKALRPGFQAENNYDVANVEKTLGDTGLEYNRFLDTEAKNFQEDKKALDQNAADKGVLFSGGRVEKEKKLASDYASNLDYTKNKVASDLGGVARNFAYQYGDKAVNNPSISSYFNLGGNVYNPKLARNNVGASPLANMVKNTSYGFQGTKNVSNMANTNIRAANLLKNKGNKLLSTGYLNQL